MSVVQVERRPAGALGQLPVPAPSLGVSSASSQLIERLKSVRRPAPSEVKPQKTVKTIEEQLYDALATFKWRTALVAMHLDRDWRYRLFRQFDSLLSPEDWDINDPPPSTDSFSTFIRMLVFLKPQRRPGLGASSEGTVIATWSCGEDRLTMDCLPGDSIRWHLSVTIDGDRERAAGVTPIQRLASVLSPYQPQRWLGHADQVSR